MRRSCSQCGRTVAAGNRCSRHRLPPRGREHRQVRAMVLATATRCAICLLPPFPDDPLTFDHIVPRAAGGATSLDNAQAVHRSCNSRKGVRT